MKPQETIPVAELQTGLSAIDAEACRLHGRLSKLIDERSHIAHVLKKYTRERIAPSVAVSSQMTMPITAADPMRGTMQKKIVEVLLAKRQPMKSEAILAELALKGIMIRRNSFDALMAKMHRDPKFPVVKTEYAHYQYCEKYYGQTKSPLPGDPSLPLGKT